MKKAFIALAFAFFHFFSDAQHTRDFIPPNTEEIRKASLYITHLPELRQWIDNRNNQTGQTNFEPHTTLFRWPMRVNSNYDDIPDYNFVTNYMDIYRLTSSRQEDWYCNNQEALNYNGHQGNDYNIYPFFWRMKNNNNAFACAGAPGVVITVIDSLTNDNNCQRDSLESNNGNQIIILHSDSSITRYVHIKTGSARVVEGQFVERGKILALIASSGNSSNPHLHFDLKYFRDNDSSFNYIEPFKNPMNSAYPDCNLLTNTSWWQNQPTYVNPKLLRVMTHSAVPQIMGPLNETDNGNFCPELEDAKPKSQFSGGDLLVIGAALAHVTPRDTVFINVYTPNNVLWLTESLPVPEIVGNRYIGFRRHQYLTFSQLIPAGAMTGTYRIETSFKFKPFDSLHVFASTKPHLTQTFNSYFTIGCLSSKTLNSAVSVSQGHIVSNSISSIQLITAGKTMYQSANYIQLNPGFEAKAGSTVKARIRDCNFSD